MEEKAPAGRDDVRVRVANLERFATHDGPGIRTTVFLEGCPLHCPWCANPETQSGLPALFHDAERCVGCRECEGACPEHAIAFVGGTFSFDPARCSGCRLCERSCLHEALELQGRTRTAGDVLDEAERDRDYYETSGGGLTLSGGEPLANSEWALALLKGARARGLDTAVETTGNVAAWTIEAAEPLVDHFLYDLKHLDDETLRRVTGGDGRLVKANLALLLQRCPEKVNVRIPVIPGFNHDPELLVAMIDWLKAAGALRVNLLPYHTLARDKYRKMGREYECPPDPLDDRDLSPFHEYALSIGMESKIGA
ncbi:MAG: glycyl-radical enzyme activating protein [Atopobiaceae bacterium]|jgi:pyruvate formate lyase activating enzyme|nr:glycyl-radical enzyme activating protein [Atopobiaceae bacterium]